MMTGKKKIILPVAVISLFTLCAFTIYYPIVGNTFLSDDYDSLYRIIIEKRILYREWLRPMIDISFYFNYFLSGLSPRSFYIFNIAVHILNTYLVFILAGSLVFFDEKNSLPIALTAAFLFLIYPFHNESIAWLSGRLSSMAVFFALLALVFSVKKKTHTNLFLSLVCYLAGLLCYEAIILLPIMVVVLNRRNFAGKKEMLLYSCWWLFAAVVYLLGRLLLSGGEITGDYGGRVTDNHWTEKLLNIAKVTGRMFFPPSDNQRLLTGLTILLLLLVGCIIRFLLKNKILTGNTAFSYRSLLLCLAISSVVPVAFGVSTRTSEGDRLLYFPSCFLCILAGNLFFTAMKLPISRMLILSMVSFYCIWLLEVNNRHWVKASALASAVMDISKNSCCKVAFINMPDEVEGAFVFRNGFAKALEINAVDKKKIQIVNYLNRVDFLQAAPVIAPVHSDSAVLVRPVARIVRLNQNYFQIVNTATDRLLTVRREQDAVYYWNKDKMVRLF